MENPKFHFHKEIADRERVLRLAQAAEEVGGVAVHALNDEGESAYTNAGKRITVPEGKVQISVSGMMDDLNKMHAVRERHEAQRAA